MNQCLADVGILKLRNDTSALAESRKGSRGFKGLLRDTTSALQRVTSDEVERVLEFTLRDQRPDY